MTGDSTSDSTSDSTGDTTGGTTRDRADDGIAPGGAPPVARSRRWAPARRQDRRARDEAAGVGALVTTGPSHVSVTAAMRARDVSRPGLADPRT